MAASSLFLHILVLNTIIGENVRKFLEITEDRESNWFNTEYNKQTKVRGVANEDGILALKHENEVL